MIIYNAPYSTDTFNYAFGPEPFYNATDMYLAETFSEGANKTKFLSLFKGDLQTVFRLINIQGTFSSQSDTSASFLIVQGAATI